MVRIGAFILLALILVVGVFSSQTPTSVASAQTDSVKLSEFRANGGRVAWSPDGEFIVFDRKGIDGGFDLYLTRDMKSERCLTCNHPDLPNQSRNYGQPVIHPNGRYIVFQAEKQKHGFVVPLATNPGAGVFNDLWLYDLETKRARPVWEVPNNKNSGVLHPRFLKDGTLLSWSELYGSPDFKFPGKHAAAWTLKVATVGLEGLKNVVEIKPPGEDVIYENHGFSHDNQWLYFSSNMKRTEAINESTNIYRMHMKTQKLEQLTDEGYNEHAHITPDGKYIVWMSSVGNGDSYDYYKVGTDYWVMNMDGTEKRRLTHLNDPNHPHFRGRYAVAADFDFDPRSPQNGRYRMVAYLHELVTKNFGKKALDRKAKGEYNFLVEFSVDPNDTAEVPPIAAPPGSNPMVHADGTRLLNGKGEQVKLRGVLLEGWLMWNGSLWGTGLNSESHIYNRIKALVGDAEAARFQKEIYDTFITERDIEMIADLGLNAVRVPFNHTVLEKNGEIDYSAPGWFYIDRLLEWCKKNGVYVVLDLHSLPGGQSSVFVADPDQKKVWSSEKDQQRTVDLWKAIAKRYRNNSMIAGYDLINEPEPPKHEDLTGLYRRIIKAIREVDPHHMVIMTGTALSTDLSLFKGPLDDNQAYTFHSYNFFTKASSQAALEKQSAITKAHNVPLWNGEFGAHTAEWVGKEIQLYEDPKYHVSGWIFWPWKKVGENDWRKDRFQVLMGIKPTKNWDKVRYDIASLFGGGKVPKAVARQGLADFLKAAQPEKLVANDRLVRVLRDSRRSDGHSDFE